MSARAERRLAARVRSIEVPLLVGAAASLCLIGVVSMRGLPYGWPAGNWFYPYLRSFQIRSLLSFAVVLPCALALAHFSLRSIDRREWATLLVCLGVGFALQLAMRWPYPFPIEMVVRSVVANSFYEPSLRLGLAEFIRNHAALLDSLPMHTHTNMPGKLSLYIVLGWLTHSPLVMGWLVIILSNFGGLLVYRIAREFVDRRAGVFALILYLFLPSKLFFFPLLNTVSPLLILISFDLFLRFLGSGRPIFALLLGVALYFTLFFDPIPLAMGLAFAAFVVRSSYRGELGVGGAALLVGGTAVGFAVVHAAMWWGLQFDVFATLAEMIDKNTAGHARLSRSYEVWLVGNLVEFALGLGMIQVVIFLAVLGRALRRITWSRVDLERLTEPGTLLAFSLLGVLVCLDLLGMTMGEVIRTWIFLACFFPIVTAYFCARKSSSLLFGAVLSLLLLEAVVPLGMVGFVIPVDQLRP